MRPLPCQFPGLPLESKQCAPKSAMEDPQSKCRHIPAEATLQSTASTLMLGQSLLMHLEYLLGHMSGLMPVEFQWTTCTCKSQCPAHPELSRRAPETV